MCVSTTDIHFSDGCGLLVRALFRNLFSVAEASECSGQDCLVVLGLRKRVPIRALFSSILIGVTFLSVNFNRVTRVSLGLLHLWQVFSIDCGLVKSWWS